MGGGQNTVQYWYHEENIVSDSKQEAEQTQSQDSPVK